MKVYIVLENRYDYYRFTDYEGVFSTLEAAEDYCSGSLYGMGLKDDPCVLEYENEDLKHYVIVEENL